MKYLALLFALALVVIAAPSFNRLYITWDDSPDYDNDVSFYIYTQTNAGAPVSGWSVATNVTYGQWTNHPARRPGEAGLVELPRSIDHIRFYAVTASNVFGESDFSDAVSVRRAAPPTRLKIGVLP